MEVDKKLVDSLAKQIREKVDYRLDIGVVLGSGLSEILNKMEDKIIIEYTELKGMLIPHVKGHKNQFIIGKLFGKGVIAMQGRLHPYDGFTAKEVVLPIYIFKQLGVESCIITTSAGALNKSYTAGDVMLIKDHINFTGINPLIDGAIIKSDEQFIDLKGCYFEPYRNLIKNIAKSLKIKIKDGVFVQVLGPSYETPAEVDMFRKMGGDAVSMSTALEVIAAKQCGLKTLGFACISNKAVSYKDKHALTHDEVLENSKLSAQKLESLLFEFVKNI